jgi:hypothetical protein
VEQIDLNFLSGVERLGIKPLHLYCLGSASGSKHLNPTLISTSFQLPPNCRSCDRLSERRNGSLRLPPTRTIAISFNPQLSALISGFQLPNFDLKNRIHRGSAICFPSFLLRFSRLLP